MNEYLLSLLTKHRKKGILIDTNLLLLFVVGSLDPALIPKISRPANYSIGDFQILSRVVDFFETKITTPHILTEASNLVDRLEIREALRSFVMIATERFIESLSLSSHRTFRDFGLADAAIFDISKEGYLVLSNDGPLIGLLTDSKLDVIDMNMLRSSVDG